MGKSSKPIVAWHYRPAFHHGLTTAIDGLLEFRGGDKTAWQGNLTESGTISVNAPNLWGGEKDQGGIVGDLDVMFGEATQVPNAYLVSVFGEQTAAWRGFTTIVFKGGRYGAVNPYPQKASYKIWKIWKGWDNDECWYPETAAIVANGGDSPALIERFDQGDLSLYSVLEGIDSGFSIDVVGGRNVIATATSSPDSHNVIGRPLPFPAALYRVRVRFMVTDVAPDDAGALTVRDAGGAVVMSFISCRQASVDALRRPSVQFADASGVPGELIGAGGVVPDEWYSFDSIYDQEAGQFTCTLTRESDGSVHGTLDVPVTGRADVAFLGWTVDDFAGAGRTVWTDAEIIVGNLTRYINPAHVLYDSRTSSDMGREPIENINDASMRAAADKLFAEAFGICPEWDPATESVEEFEQRICKLIGGSFTRSLEDGQWYLDLARPDYVLEDLPILTDDDILDFKEQPSVLDSVINSVSVRYFDPEKKETIVTPPVRALGLVASFGTIHQTNDYPEIPTAELGARVSQRDLLASATPTRVFNLTTTRRSYAWRPNQYFRLQSPKRGIADMVCIGGEKQSGTLKSGAIRFNATQDIYSLPSTSFVQVEPGVDPSPPQTPTAIALQRAIEAPYIEVAAAMARANLDALPEGTGFAMAMAAAPAGEINFTMMAAPDGSPSYEEVGSGEWVATATVVETAERADEDFTLEDGVRLDQVEVGMAALWEDELCVVTAIDTVTGAISLGRGCADTVPAPEHAAGSRIWFYPAGFAYDLTEYTDGETMDIKLLSNTGSQQLPIGAATAMPLTFDNRLDRPYPPAKVRIDATAWPTTVTGEFDVTWATRDRLLQADQLVDTEAASTGVEPSARFALQFFDDTDTLLVEKLDIAGATATVDLSVTGDVRMVLYSISDAGDSWQRHDFTFGYTAAGGTDTIDADTYDPYYIVLDGGGA